MILTVHTDALYLSEMGGKSRAAGHFYLTNINGEDFNNGSILMLSSIIKHVMSSASEAEMAPLYHGCKVAAPLRTTLEEMGHDQPKPTLVTTDNITALGLTTHHGHHDAQSLQVYGSMFLLAQVQECPTPVPIPVVQRHPKQSRLCKQILSP